MFDTITLTNLNAPICVRPAVRRIASPSKWSPTRPGTGRGFYMDSSRNRELTMNQDETFRLRVELANDHLRGYRLREITGYCVDPYNDGDAIVPIIARLPKGRGFLAGWTLGRGMASFLEPEIWTDPEDAAFAAHNHAEYAAEDERRFHEEELARIQMEEIELMEEA